jgi:dephospho-CoA kinase
MPNDKNLVFSIMAIIGITGGIATGKSTAAKILRDKGYSVICADTIAHQLLKKTKTTARQILNHFGTLNRKKLAHVIFKNPQAKKKLESIIHPAVIRETKKQIAALKKKQHRLIFLDVPLLFESGMDKLCDKTICVWAPKKTQIERMLKKRKMTRKEALSRIKAQMPLRQKMKKSNYIVKNASTPSELIKKMAMVLRDLS